jgi:pSer/pThr/pTyr-binding forkhead associated (FHA) protein
MTGEPSYKAAPVVAEVAPRLALVVHAGAKAGMRIPCRRVVTLIGSRPGCKVNLQHSSIAPVHTAIVNGGTKVCAIDLASARGTKLNGLKMEQESLSHGDLLELGAWEFRVELRQPQSGLDSDDAHSFEFEHSPEAVVLEHLDTGRVLKPNRDICVIGRRSGCDIKIDDDRVSRAHALLLHYFGFPAVCDLLSKTGTLVNGEPAPYRVLKDEDVLELGGARFRVRLLGSKVGRKREPQPAAEPEPEKASADSDTSATDTGMIQLASDETGSDLIDIEAVEGSQRWRVADQLEKLSRKA